METLVIIAVIAVAIGIGTRLIHLLNAQHDARIAAHHFSAPPAEASRPAGRHRTSGPPHGNDR
ncbi:hypothetical protein GCM10010521_20930 [Streptomyces rameus]|uniref:Uncharacterized protein n=1 Tax=Streptomyces rameus TaxID=68261 RepID=A0ABP6N2Z1_9ACTN